MENEILPPIKVQRVLSTPPIFDESAARSYWLSRSPQERLQHVEFLRRINYGHRATERLQRIFAVARCEWS